MKKIFTFVATIIILLSLVACTPKINNTFDSVKFEKCVAYNLYLVDKDKNLSEENLKALSIMIRTNLYMSYNNFISENLSNNAVNMTCDSIKFDNYKSAENFDNLSTSDKNKFEKITKSTSGLLVYKNNNPFYCKFSFESLDSENSKNTENKKNTNLVKDENKLSENDKNSENNDTDKNSEDEKWQVSIKKSSILSFLSKNKILVANISDITPTFDKNNSLTKITIAGKDISFDLLKENFNLKSAKITNIENKTSVIIISGIGEDKNDYYDITNAENYALNGYDYNKLLKHFYYNYTLKTM